MEAVQAAVGATGSLADRVRAIWPVLMDDATGVRVIEQALAVILARHPEGVLLVHGACPRGADAIAVAYAARTPAATPR